MNKTNIYKGKEAIDGIASGINAVADIVKLTLGAKGMNVIIETDLPPFHIITNDGISIADACYFDNPLEQRGADLVKEVNKLTDKGSGDGRTTTTVLLQAIINEAIEQGVSGIELQKSLNELIPMIESEIDKQKKVITENDIASVAIVSGEDVDIGHMIQEIYQQIGKDGIILLDNSNTDQTYYEIKEGVRFEKASLVSSAMFNQGQQAVYEKPCILVTKSRLSSTSEIEPIITKMVNSGKKDLVIFCDDMDNNVAATLIATHVDPKFPINVAIIKAPTIWKDLIFEDFAASTGSTIVSDGTGLTFKNLELEHLGTCGKITTDKFETVLIGIKDISDHIEMLKENFDENTALRLSWLNTKAAVLKVGASSESELSYIKRKASDALHACYLALQDGVVAGGGLALFNVAEKLPGNNGGSILKKALKAPLKQIMENSGIHYDPILPIGEEIGYDAKLEEVRDMWEAGILDPAMVVKNAIRNAISVAGTVLTAGGVITKKPKSEEEKMNEMMRTLRPF